MKHEARYLAHVNNFLISQPLRFVIDEKRFVIIFL